MSSVVHVTFSRPITFVVASALVALTSCGGTAGLRSAAEALSSAADECLLDVRDRRLTFERSPNCSSLSPLATTYINAGGFRHEPADIALVAERARRTAWTARAVSLAGGTMLSFW